MELTDYLAAERIACNVDAHSKKRALEKLSELIARGANDSDATEVFDTLLSRERLGGTGIGHGVAIPHGRLKHGTQPRAALLRLKQPVDFDAIDNEPVDLLFALVVPEQSTEEHLKILAMLAAMFQDPGFRQRLRQAGSAEEIMQAIRDWQAQH